MSQRCLTEHQKKWAYQKWCEGYTMIEIAEALYCCEHTIRRALEGKQKIKRPLKYEEGEAF